MERDKIMLELYKIADQLLEELKTLRKSGTSERTIQEYINKILDYLDEKSR